MPLVLVPEENIQQRNHQYPKNWLHENPYRTIKNKDKCPTMLEMSVVHT